MVAASMAGSGAIGVGGSAWCGATSSTCAIGSSSAIGAGAATGFTVLTRRGGGSIGAAGFGGSGAFLAGSGFLPLCTGVSAKMSPVGNVILRCLERRSTNCRATTSSIVLDALFTSMPWSRLRSAVTSWLVVLRSSATL
jgi:hypothetical protein